jgi:hypothetical protein
VTVKRKNENVRGDLIYNPSRGNIMTNENEEEEKVFNYKKKKITGDFPDVGFGMPENFVDNSINF